MIDVTDACSGSAFRPDNKREKAAEPPYIAEGPRERILALLMMDVQTCSIIAISFHA